MSIKYSEILAADEVLSAGANDIIVLAIVDGGAPTGYTTKAIKTSNLLSGATPNLQQVLDTGSSASGITTKLDVFVDNNTVEFYSNKTVDGSVAAMIIDATAASGFTYADGVSGFESNFRITSTTMIIQDTLNQKGVSYDADYSANNAANPRWIPDKAYVDASGGSNIYTASDALTSARTVTLTSVNDLTFQGGKTTFKGQNDLVSATTIEAQNNSGSKILQVRNDGSLVFGKDTGGAIQSTFTFKAPGGTTAFMRIEDESGNDAYNFTKGQISLHSGNAGISGGANSSEIRLSSINNIWNTTIQAAYNGQYYLALRNATQTVNLFYTEGSKKGYTLLGLNGANRGLKIGGTGTENLALALDVRDASNVALMNVTTATGNVTIGGVSGADRLGVSGGDFRAEGLTDSNLFVTDHSADKVYIGGSNGDFARFNVNGLTTTGFITSVSRTNDAGVGGNGYKATVNARGAEVRTVRTNGNCFSISNEWTIGDSRLSFQFNASVNENSINVISSADGLETTARIGDEISWWKRRAGSPFGFGFGHSTPTNSTIHTKFNDFLVEGATDANLFFLDNSTNQLSIGSTPYANVKASVTNTEAVTYSFLVLNQATTAEFSVRETGVVYTNGILGVGVPSPTSASKIQIGLGDLELDNTGWFYCGDPSTDGSWRFGPNGGSNFLHQRREAGIWVTKQTITP